MQVPPKKYFIYGPDNKNKPVAVANNGVAPSSAKAIADGLKEAGVPAEHIVVSSDMGALLEKASSAARKLKTGAAGAGKPTLVMPGGVAPVIQAGVPARSTRTLQSMLKEGSVDYIGVCAGCYLAAESWSNKQRSQPMLGLVAGLKTVEPRVMAKPLPMGQFPSEPLRLNWKGSEGDHAVSWHGGPKFAEKAPDQVEGYQVLATAQDARLKDSDPAIVTMQSGAGKVTLSSVHPEYPLKEDVGLPRAKRLEVFRMVFGLPPQEEA